MEMLKEKRLRMAGKQRRKGVDSESKREYAQKTWKQRRVFRLSGIFIDREREDEA
jgi:hypothetical protein